MSYQVRETTKLKQIDCRWRTIPLQLLSRYSGMLSVL
jgi:hypothetical protein